MHLGFGINRIRPARSRLLCRADGIRVFIRHSEKRLVPWGRFIPLLRDGTNHIEINHTVKSNPYTVVRVSGVTDISASHALNQALAPLDNVLEVYMPNRRKPTIVVGVRNMTSGYMGGIVIEADDRKDYS